MQSLRRQQLKSIYENGLFEDVIPFWLQHGIDEEYGGFFTCLDRSGAVIDSDKAVWQQGRFTWLLAKLYNEFPNHCSEQRSVWLRLANQGADFLEQHCFDPTDGRMWFHLTRDGKPIRKRRYAYSESFAAIAFAQLAKAQDDSRYAQLAINTFNRFVEHSNCDDPLIAKTTQERPLRSIGIPMITLVTAQELRDAIDFEQARDWIEASIAEIQKYHVKPEECCVMETVSQNGEIVDHFDGRTLNPGHAIEASWFIMDEGMKQSNPELISLGTTILDWMWERGWDSKYGGMLYFTDLHDHPVQEYWHDMKFWWPQNETMIATLMAYRATGNEKYALWHQRLHDWVYAHFPDTEHGEWFGYLDRTGRVTSTAKGNFWKGPFHLPRMQMTCARLLDF
ncbi:AGE family epimerase/isomerase [bacterium]|nr:AGE family epimerase/isomerase [bacterium]